MNRLIGIALLVLVAAVLLVGNLLTIYEHRKSVLNFVGISGGEIKQSKKAPAEAATKAGPRKIDYSSKADQREWAKKVAGGGYVLFFRHAERNKWLDVHMYDVLDVQGVPLSDDPTTKEGVPASAVCLNARGLVQARVMGEYIRSIGLPYSKVITSPICRAKQTAELAFGGYQEIENLLIYRGIYNEKVSDHVGSLRPWIADLTVPASENVILSGHGSVMHEDLFSNVDEIDFIDQGGFYVISIADNELNLEFQFHNFKDFSSAFQTRPGR